MVIRDFQAKKKSRQDRKEDGGNLLSWLDFTTSSERIMVRLSRLSNQSIKVTEDLSILPVGGKWNNMAVG
jgi:hypothetical protein